MNDRDDTDKTTAGSAALSICESLLIALNDLKIIDDKETRAVLVDAAQTHRNAITDAPSTELHSPNSEEHRAIADLIDRIVDGRNSVRAF